MRYIFNNFLNTLKRYKVSSLLNIIGMAVAFAAFYVIMTQVCFNLGYNKSLKDADRTFVLSVPSQYNEGKFSIFINRRIFPVSSGLPFFLILYTRSPFLSNFPYFME